MMKNKQGLNHDLQDLHDSKNNTTKSGQSLNQKNQCSDNLQPFYNTTIPSDWEVMELGKIFKLTSGKTKPAVLFENPADENIYPVYGGNGIMGYASEYNSEGEKIIIGRVGEYCGVTRFLNELCWITDNALLTKEFLIDIDIKFLAFKLQQEDLSRLRSKGGQPLVSQVPISIHKIVVPRSLPEQKAIAHILGLMDSAINTNNQLIAQKELRKKWLMQNLLTGKKRLKGFNREWKEYHLGSLGDTYTGLTGKSKEDFGEGKPYIPYLNIFFNTKIDTTNFDYVKITEQDKQNKAQYGDIFFTVSSETPDEVGMASVLLEHIDELYLNSFCFGFRLHDFKTLVPQFSSYFLRADAFREEIYKLSQGATRFNLSKTNLMKLIVILPPIEEQIAIAQVLQAADKEIQLLKTKTEKLKEQKKWLMQVLLTGKKRLNYDSSDLYDDYDSNANYKSDKSQESEKS